MLEPRVTDAAPPLTSAAFLAAELCWAMAGGGGQVGLRPTSTMFVGGSGSGSSPAGPSA